ncbi:MAG: phosphatidylserine decarboxylase family protein [Acidobacteria bacterium]|nr:phosphatidylserine decarboxylase family protein [Acidobacteriota bacterium]
MRIDSAGLPFIGGALAGALVSGIAIAWAVAIPFLVLAGFFTFFFRDPDRQPPTDEHAKHAVLSPADGRVLVAGPATPDAAPPGSWQQISIFLSPMDVHVNRIPVSGRVTRLTYTPGTFVPAYHHDAAKNERSEIWIDHHGQFVVARQIVGALARRVVCRVAPGADVLAGQRFGIMKFGSRMDVFVPPTASLMVKVGDMVRGGETIIAVLH